MLLGLATLALSLLAGQAAQAVPTELYFSDDFSGGANARFFYEGTLDQRDFAYLDGEYEIDTSQGSSYGQSVLTEDLDNYRVEVSGRLLESQDSTGGGFGLSFNYRENSAANGSDFLLFLVYDRGAYTVLRYFEGQTSVLLTPTKTKLFGPGTAVTLTVDSVKGQLSFYINGAEVGKLKEDRLVSGGMGMFATARSVARFDDFRIYATRPEEAAGFSDDFSETEQLYAGTWGEVTYSYDGGEYIIDTSQTQYIGLSPFPDSALDFVFEADVRLLAGDPVGGYGLYLRDWPNDEGGFNQFRFLVSGNWFAVEQSVDDKPLALAQWSQHSAVHEGGVNRIKVRAEGKELKFYVNGEQVYSYTDANPHSGAYGFFASAGLRVAFDNMSFLPLQ